MTPQLQEMFKKSLKSNRWKAIDLGAADQYTHDNMVARWVVEKNKWLQVSSRNLDYNTDKFVNGVLTSSSSFAVIEITSGRRP